MTTRFLSRKFSWRRVLTGVLIGVVILFICAFLFVYLATQGILACI